MGKKSIRENKTPYQLSREAAGLTREKASDALVFLSADRIEKIESGRSAPHPDEVLAMAACYKEPALPNRYCSHACPIGQKYVPETADKALSQIVLETLALLGSLDNAKQRLIEITVDGKITADEYEDFSEIQRQLRELSGAFASLQLWMERQAVDGKLDLDALQTTEP